MQRNITISKKPKKNDSAYVLGSAAQRIAYVWPLTAEVCAFGGKYDAEQRLQRHIVRFEPRKS